jgi:DNA-directed RNA polymerase specialized sigma24 family protein
MSPYDEENRQSEQRDPYTQFIAMLSDDQHEGEQKYLELRGKLIRYFSSVKRLRDPETLTDETINRAVLSIQRKGERPNSIDAWCFAIASKVASEKYRQNQKEETDYDFTRAADPHSVNQLTGIETDGDDPRIDCLRQCVASLNKDDRDLVLEYFNDEVKSSENRRRMAEKLDLKQNTLRKQIGRLKDKLKLCIEKCVARKGKL